MRDDRAGLPRTLIGDAGDEADSADSTGFACRYVVPKPTVGFFGPNLTTVSSLPRGTGLSTFIVRGLDVSPAGNDP